MNMPGYSPVVHEQESRSFILRDPRSGVAGIPLDPLLKSQAKKPSGQPGLPGEDKKMIEGVYGQPGLQPSPRACPNETPDGNGYACRG
jgi:hypothetical protein